MDVSIDKDLCVGCGICSDKCPGIFALVEKVAIVKTAPSDEDETCCRDAAESCPVNAIAIEE